MRSEVIVPSIGPRDPGRQSSWVPQGGRPPAPGPGDLAYATGDGPDGILSCISVEVDGTDVDGVDLVLTATVPGP